MQVISQGDVIILGNYFDDFVEVFILDKDDVYVKVDVIGVVWQFFSQYCFFGWSIVYKGVVCNNDFQYCIGNFLANGQIFWVYIYMKEKNGCQFIQELCFDCEQ